MKAIILFLAAAVADDYPKTMIYDGMPPPQLRGGAVMTVSTGTVAECGDAGNGHVFEACTRGAVVHLPNPCNYPTEKFAVLMCHETAHIAHGWPADHGPQ